MPTALKWHEEKQDIQKVHGIYFRHLKSARIMSTASESFPQKHPFPSAHPAYDTEGPKGNDLHGRPSQCPWRAPQTRQGCSTWVARSQVKELLEARSYMIWAAPIMLQKMRGPRWGGSACARHASSGSAQCCHAGLGSAQAPLHKTLHCYGF